MGTITVNESFEVSASELAKCLEFGKIYPDYELMLRLGIRQFIHSEYYEYDFRIVIADACTIDFSGSENYIKAWSVGKGLFLVETLNDEIKTIFTLTTFDGFLEFVRKEKIFISKDEPNQSDTTNTLSGKRIIEIGCYDKSIEPEELLDLIEISEQNQMTVKFDGFASPSLLLDLPDGKLQAYKMKNGKTIVSTKNRNSLTTQVLDHSELMNTIDKVFREVEPIDG